MGTSLPSPLLVLVRLPESVYPFIQSNPSGLLFVWGVLLAPNGLGFFGRPLGSFVINHFGKVLNSNLHKMGMCIWDNDVDVDGVDNDNIYNDNMRATINKK